MKKKIRVWQNYVRRVAFEMDEKDIEKLHVDNSFDNTVPPSAALLLPPEQAWEWVSVGPFTWSYIDE